MPRSVSTKPLVEGALLAAVTVVLALVGFYVPVVGAVVAFLWPVPVALVHMRHGFRVSILTVVVAGLTLASFVGPLEALGMVAAFGFAGLAMGFCFERRLSSSVAVLAGALAALLSTGVSMLVSFIFLKISPMQMLAEASEALNEASEIYRRLGLFNEQQMEEMKKIAETVREMMRYLFPALFGISSIAMSFLNFSMARAVLNRLGYKIEALPNFETWRIPPVGTLGLVAGMGAYFLKDKGVWNWAYLVGANVQVFVSVLFVIHGMAVAWWFMANRWNVSKPMRLMIMVLAYFNPLFNQVLLWLGVFDSMFDLRKIGFGSGR